jgi:NHLM bacteriocin system ABC transporter ATP-binding protein
MTTPANALRDGQPAGQTTDLVPNQPVAGTGYAQAAITFDKSVDEGQQLQLRQRTDRRNFSLSLGALATLLDQDKSQGLQAVSPGTLMADTLRHVLRAGGVDAVIKPTDPALDAFDALQQMAQQAGVSLRRVKLDGNSWWREDAGPLLATLKSSGQPVALLPLATGGGYHMVDMASGQERSSQLDAVTAAQLSGDGFMFFRKFPARAISLLDLLRFGLSTTHRDALTMLVCGLLGGLLALFTPFATGILVDTVIPNARGDELLQLTLLLMAAALGVAAFELARSLALLRLEGHLGNASEAAVIERLFNLPAPFFKRYAAGDLAQRAFSINSILHQLTSTTQSIVLTWVFGLFSFVYMLMLNWQLGLVATALVALIVIVTVSVNFWRLRLERQLYALQGAIASRVLQILNGIGKLRASGAEDRAFVLWALDFARQKQVDMKARGLGNLLDVFNASFIVLASATLFASIAFFQKDISTGVFVTFNTAFMQFLSATLALAGALTSSLSIIPLYERAKPILTTLPEQQESQIRSAPLQGDVEIGRVSFRYAEDGPLVLDDVSIRVKKGEFVAFVGPSGSGKSTIFRVLLGFEKPQSGSVYYDSQDLAGLDVGSVRRQLGVVLQNGKLMPGDIFTNIVGSSQRTLAEAWEAARMAGLAQDIEAMPMGMQTVISEGAGTISGGQRQRLMIARALVNRPAVLLFDEATSALDNQNQAIVANSVKQLQATRIVIAHRLSTIIQADRIFVIVAGKVVETGNYSELMALGGHFAELSKRQQV